MPERIYEIKTMVVAATIKKTVPGLPGRSGSIQFRSVSDRIYESQNLGHETTGQSSDPQGEPTRPNGKSEGVANNKMRSYIIKPNGETTPVVPKERHGLQPEDFSLEELQEIVGGYIQVVRIPIDAEGTEWIMVLNEEGKLKGLPFNEEATKLYQHGEVDPIVGTVLVCPSRMLK